MESRHLALTVLERVARHGRVCLILGLLAGLALPDLAEAMRPVLPGLVAVLLCLTAMRVGAPQALGQLGHLRRVLAQVFVLQALLPMAALTAVLWIQPTVPPILLGCILMLAAPSLTGAANFAIMTGHDPAPAMRLIVLSTALFPLTVLPVLWLLPQLGGAEGLWAAARLITVILLAVATGFALRHAMRRHVKERELRALDGLTAIALAVVVVGLMSAIGPLLRADPVRLVPWLAAAFAMNIGMQLLSFALYRGEGRVAVSIIAGNRNIALFLLALPAHVIEPLLVFIGCYQIPMYLTPLLMKWLHDRA